MNMRQKLVGTLVILSFSACAATSTSQLRDKPQPWQTFHDGEVQTCKFGETGYFATMLAEGGRVFTFLSSQFPPSSKTIVCVLHPDTLLQVKVLPKKEM